MYGVTNWRTVGIDRFEIRIRYVPLEESRALSVVLIFKSVNTFYKITHSSSVKDSVHSSTVSIRPYESK